MTRKSQFERRKEREEELTKQSEPAQKQETVKEEEKDSTYKAFDVVEAENGKYDMITIEYDLDTKKGKVVDQRRIDRTVGMIFVRRKIAMENLK